MLPAHLCLRTQIGGAVPSSTLAATSAPALTVDIASAERCGFLYQKERGTDWRSWKLRWCVVQSSPPTLVWTKPPKIGKDDVKAEGSLNLPGCTIHLGRLNTPAQLFFQVKQPEGSDILFASGARTDAVEWIHLLQYLAGHLVGDEAEADEADALQVEEKRASMEKEMASQELSRIEMCGYVMFQKDKGEWCGWFITC